MVASWTDVSDISLVVEDEEEAGKSGSDDEWELGEVGDKEVSHKF